MKCVLTVCRLRSASTGSSLGRTQHSVRTFALCHLPALCEMLARLIQNRLAYITRPFDPTSSSEPERFQHHPEGADRASGERRRGVARDMGLNI